MWIRTGTGTLVNLDQVEYLAVEPVEPGEEDAGGFEVRAYPVGQSGSDEDLFYGLRTEPDRKAADAVLDRVFNALRGGDRIVDLRGGG